MNIFLAFLSRLSRLTLWSLSLSSMILLGVIDYLTGFEISFAFFYLLPVSLAAWTLGRRASVFISFASAATWLCANLLAGERYSGSLIPYWNAATRAGFFLIVTYLLSELSRLYQNEKQLARTDFMTGALNSRAFYDVVAHEINRIQRNHQPLTLIYIDLDGFKQINDQLGHNIGDLVLRTVVQTFINNLRAVDFTARLGGDEFAIMLPETDAEAARTIATRLRHALLQKMQENDWPITSSIGVITCQTPPPDAQEVIRLADQIMYTVKNNNKNDINYAIYPVPG